MIEDLARIFGSRTKAIEILTLLNGTKQVVRQGFYDNELQRVKDFCKRKGLFIEYSSYKVVIADCDKPYSNKGIKVSTSDPRRGMIFVYISKDLNKAVMASIFELKNDHRSLGLLLGYPECCVKFYVKHEPERRNIDADLISCTLENSRGVTYPFYTNISKRGMDITLLDHFPCSFNCEKSIELAIKKLSLITQDDPNLGMKYAHELKCRVAIGRRFVEFA